MKRYKLLGSLFLLAAMFFSCVKKDEYKKFLVNGEIVYPGRPDSVIVRSGHNRVQIAVALANDPLVTSIKVFWKNFQDSVVVSVKGVSRKDTVRIDVPNLSEGNYNFTLYTYDEKGNRSVGITTAGMAYGEAYINSLNTRTLRSIEASADGTDVNLTWGAPSSGETGTEITYTAADGKLKQLTLKPDSSHITLQGFKDNTDISYRSVFVPDSLSIDHYYSVAQTAKLPAFERLMNKALFTALLLPTDVNEGGYGWLEQYLWDDNYNPPGFATESILPCWFTLDMGQSVSLSRIKYWQPADRLYDQQSVKVFEVYGSNNPNPDGSWAGWIKLSTCTSTKPSGLPTGQIGPNDAAYAMAGESFPLPDHLPKFRYIRIKVLEVWGSGDFAAMEEFNFYTHDH
ncbi:hypothetical protein DYU05_06430 [Mucilaginibacter terrenus]|uniref:DUF5000 domain-containing protein n=1 Tax=Mucilaginibacter terrenus TaxID=2482727 RepID=A0A3E2NW59_9SPHI|nr:DUF4998 domain-containing protein [Mucilaginibacter terrenus]RFZ85232.1 hypothetical protein DYU05_06430 [Mucilaginibacter terrenus]